MPPRDRDQNGASARPGHARGLLIPGFERASSAVPLDRAFLGLTKQSLKSRHHVCRIHVPFVDEPLGDCMHPVPPSLIGKGLGEVLISASDLCLTVETVVLFLACSR
jgi:hypothetical protein